MPAKYVRPYSKGQENDFRDAEGDGFETGRFSKENREAINHEPRNH